MSSAQASVLNVGIVAQVDAGKTSLTERLLFEAGVVGSPGSVDAGTTRTDSMVLERRRGITIRAAVTSFVLGDLDVNLVDTPGRARTGRRRPRPHRPAARPHQRRRCARHGAAPPRPAHCGP
ncbi:MAG: GTP-binding protein, partial [Nocardioidaceae bacterium]|nr:GTP-binding protein [Nocardioidaceae bacterium]